MRFLAFASRNQKEIIRDPLTILFGIGLPVVVMWLFTIMQQNMPMELYKIENLTPGVIVFSFAFLTLFSGMLIGKDKGSSFLMRIFVSPLRPSDYIIGYTIPLILIAMMQIVVCFITAYFLDLKFDWNVIVAIAVLLVNALLYLGFGLMLGTFFTDKQVGGIFALFVNIATWLSGTWFTLDMIGGVFENVASVLPFVHAVEVTRLALQGDYGEMLVPLIWVVGYTVVLYVIAIGAFRKKMRY
ncbi:ABC transporter permease [Cytobacillus praedii]|uniref:Transport permease protein n=1 Tax=Cytobacillus solani TaxID=1637975 RepID=A0A0Q3VJR3_9BACI|nr:ABC transporter permease [Cytobacillus solani]KOP79902.1 ABC transporter permease [Bacillus sp. FJAT-21945]KQL21218.1 ABC transporter permease [Cytobacillus solani]USK54523.1 ABC transporter permease [Cytobacillus solani]